MSSLLRLHATVEARQQGTSKHNDISSNNLPDNSLELAVLRKGGHLGILQALRQYPRTGSIQAMGFSVLTWLCERCIIKSDLVNRGVLPLIKMALANHLPTSPWVVAKTFYLLGNLAKLPAVAESFAKGSMLSVMSAAICRWTTSTEVCDSTMILLQSLSSHRKVPITEICMYQMNGLGLVVKYMEDSMDQLESSNVCKRRLALRQVPGGPDLDIAANKCLRAMVPVSETKRNRVWNL